MRKFDEYSAKREASNTKVTEAFLDTVPEGYVLVRFEYSDNDGQYFTALEHGPLFSKVKSLRVSKH
jgi:hypothetical protein